MIPPLARMAVAACCNLIPDPMEHHHHNYLHVEGKMRIAMGNKLESCASSPTEGADAVFLTNL